MVTLLMKYEAVIGLEVHAEFCTESKMFCSCPVVDSTQSSPNIAVCPVCAGMPGVLPVVNQKAVEYAIRVALALNCKVANTSIFDRKNYFYPDLPKGYQISQYEFPLAEHGYLPVETSAGPRDIKITRVHMEEDTGKLTHIQNNGISYSLVDLNRAGVPLLEIVSEPDMHTIEEVRAYAENLRAILRYLKVNSGDMQKGVIRFEANVSIKPVNTDVLGTRVEIKNLNSFRALERSIAYQIDQQIAKLERGESIVQETLGWDETSGRTYSQRSKEEAHDYRYFPEPDLPPLVVEDAWIEEIKRSLPELPREKAMRFVEDYKISKHDAGLLIEDQTIADYFEAVVKAAPGEAPHTIVNWITGEIFGWLKSSGSTFDQLIIKPEALAELIKVVNQGQINLPTGKTVLSEMLDSGKSAGEIIKSKGLEQLSDSDTISKMISDVLHDYPEELDKYLSGKESLANWFFGQVMAAAKGKANPSVVREELIQQLTTKKDQ